METRTLGRTGRPVAVVGFGAWQIGSSDWGDVPESQALGALEAAVEAGTTFVDTADVYGDGRSETLIGRFLREHPGAGVMVATKMGRRVEQVPESYVAENFRVWTDRSRRNLGVETLDLVQLHCPPSAVYSTDAVFDALDELVDDGVMAAYGVSVETCDEALTAIARPGVATVQIILNAFRQKPLDEVLTAASAVGVGVIARVPLASGLLSGRYSEETTFPESDHRTYNRHGEAFDVGETFAGVDFVTGVRAAQEIAAFVPSGVPMAAFALRWVLDQPGVSVVIPGARDAAQAGANAAAAALAPLTLEQLAGVRRVYDASIAEQVHSRW